MATFPWLKDVGVPYADPPIPPVTEYDDRPAVAELMSANRSKVDRVKEQLASDSLYQPEKHDDLWVLRFVLSHKKVRLAVEAAKHTLVVRKEYGLDKRDRRIDVDIECFTKFHETCDEKDFPLTIPNKQRGPVSFAVVASLHQKTLVKTMTRDEWKRLMLFTSEWNHQVADYVTRKTGRLTKLVRVLDLEGLALTDVSMAFIKREGDVSNEFEDIYPQLTRSIIIVNPPGFVQWMWRVVRPLLPKRVSSKIDILDPLRNKKERERMYLFLDEEFLPTRYGGNHKGLPAGGWIPAGVTH